MSVKSVTIQVKTKGGGDIVDITSEVQRMVMDSKFESGIANIFVVGSTAGLSTIEFEPGLVKDLSEVFEEIVPRNKYYHHHERWHDDNGHSHVRATLIGPSLTVPFVNKKLTLGTWQQIIIIDFDTRARTRDIVVQIIGE